MNNWEQTLLPDNQKFLSNNCLTPRINQSLQTSNRRKKSNRLNKTGKPLITATIAIAFWAGVDCGKPKTVLAQEVSATWAETTSLTSMLTGYESVLLGLEEVGVDGEVAVFDHSLVFSDTIAAFVMTGTIGDLDLVLNGQGFLSGDVGTEDLSWSGNWSGALGDELISTEDTGTFSFNDTDGYTNLNFQQSGFKDSDLWDATTTGELTSNIGGSLVSGWARSGTEGIGGEVSSALADFETQFASSGNSIGSDLTIDGDTQSFLLVLNNSTVIKQGNYSCEEDKKCKKTTSIPEPNSTVGIFLLLILGIVSRVTKFQQ